MENKLRNKHKNSLELIKRGVDQLISDEELLSKLNKSSESGKSLKIKLGVDPTAPDIHLGHTVPFRKLRHFQDLGHEIHFLIGDFTSRIGDPSGKNKTRPPLTEEEIISNAKTYLEQISKILNKEKLTVVYNSHWLNDLNFGMLIRLGEQITMSRLLEHNTFKERLSQSESLRFHELLYPFMQGYDSVALESDVEIGGTDQTFNLTFGRDLQKYFGQEPQVCITMPLLLGTDGVQKMSKSLGNYIGINEAPAIMFDKIMQMNDRNIINYFILLTDVDTDEINNIERQLNDNPSTQFIIESKKRLAHSIITMYHSEMEADNAINSYGEINRAGLPEIPITKLKQLNIVELMVSHIGITSNSEARRLIEQGAVKVNGKKVDQSFDIKKLEDNDIIKVGKLKTYKITK